MIIRCPECGNEISSFAKACPNCGCPASAWTAAEEPDDSLAAPAAVKEEGKQKNTLGVVVWSFVGLLAVAAVLLGVFWARSAFSGNRASQVDAVQATAKPLTAAEIAERNAAFEKEAEAIGKKMQDDLADTAKTSWTVKDMTLTVKMNFIKLSGSSIAELYQDDPDGTQEMIDDTAENLRALNETICDYLKSKGYEDFTVRFLTYTSDGRSVVDCKNGEIIYKAKAKVF